MGAFAEAVQERIRDHLQAHHPAYDWRTEYHIGGTPVDVAGEHEGHLVVVEPEWRRADPADNTAKLFRHLAGGALEDHERVDAFQAFTRYYGPRAWWRAVEAAERGVRRGDGGPGVRPATLRGG